MKLHKSRNHPKINESVRRREACTRQQSPAETGSFELNFGAPVCSLLLSFSLFLPRRVSRSAFFPLSLSFSRPLAPHRRSKYRRATITERPQCAPPPSPPRPPFGGADAACGTCYAGFYTLQPAAESRGELPRRIQFRRNLEFPADVADPDRAKRTGGRWRVARIGGKSAGIANLDRVTRRVVDKREEVCSRPVGSGCGDCRRCTRSYNTLRRRTAKSRLPHVLRARLRWEVEMCRAVNCQSARCTFARRRFQGGIGAKSQIRRRE